MAYEFSPRIYNPGTTLLTNLPKPVLQCRLPQTWDFDTQKVPLADGASTYGHSKNPMQISLQGQFGKVGATLKTTEEEMWTTFTLLSTQLDINPTSSKLEFFLYYDSGSATYAKYKEAYPVEFTVDLGDEDHTIWQYSLVLGVDDLTVYTTAEGA